MRKTGLKIVSLLLTTVFVFAVFPSLKSNADAKYEFVASTGTLTISGTGEVTQIGVRDSFGSNSDLEDLKTVVIEEGITKIGDDAFNGASNLTSVTIPTSVTSIGGFAFYGCSSLTSITIPEGVTEIGQSAFSGCSSLTSVMIPSSVKTIGVSAFYGCANLEEVYMDTELVNPCSNNGVFMFCPSDMKFYYYYNAKYSCEHGTIVGNKVTYGTDKLTIEPEEYYELVEVSYVFAGSNEKTIIKPDASGDYRMPDIDLSETNRDIVVTASFQLIQKTVTFYDEDGTTVLQSGKVDATTIPTYGGDTPTKPADEQYTYTFAGWTDGTNEYKPTDALPKVTADVTYTAMYTSTANVYTVTFTDDSGKELLSSDVEYGQNPSYKGDTPAKPADAQYTYTFAGWKDSSNTYGPTASLPVVTGDVTYTAVFESSTRKYTVTFVNYDGTLLESSQFQYGQTPIYGGDTPTKAADEQYTYTFSGWTDRIDKYSIDRLPTVTGDVTYKAAFSANNNSGVTPVKPVIEPDIRPAADVPVQTPGVYYLHSLTGDGVNTDVVAAIKRTEDDANCINYFGHAEVDGTTMTVGEQIDVGSGSTIITIKKEFLATLGEGNHTLKVYFNDGGTITIEFTVKAATNNAANVPSTGESMSYYTIAGLMLAGAGVIVFGLGQKKKRTASK